MSDADTCGVNPVSGLLPWQSYGLAFVVGIFGIRFPIPALTGLAVLWFTDRTLREQGCRLPLWVFLCCAAFGFGYASQQASELPAHTPEWALARKPVVIQAVVDSVAPRSDDRLRVILRDVSWRLDGDGGTLPGRVVLNLRHPTYRPVTGQGIEGLLRVVPARGFGNPGQWDYGWYWQRQGVFWRAWPAGRGALSWGEPPGMSFSFLKRKLRQGVAELVPPTRGGAMVLALTTGDKSRLDTATMEATRSAGLAHTLALSGLHVGFVAALGFGLAWLIGRIYPPLLLWLPRPKLAVLVAAPLVFLYAWLGQPSASLIRATAMFGAWGFLLLQGRGRVLLDGLFFALLAIAFASPLAVFDLSLQMSVAAVAGIGLMLPHLLAFFPKGVPLWRRSLHWAWGMLAVSLCANIALTPLVSWYFGIMSPNILLNLIWLPVMGLAVMPLGLLGMALSPLAWAQPLAVVCLWGASYGADALLALLDLTTGSGLTPVLAVLRPLWPEMLGCTLLLVVAMAASRSGRHLPASLAAIGFGLLIAPHLWVMGMDSRDEVRLSMLDVGLGQSLVVSVPGGHRWLVDGGGGSRHFDLGEAVVVPALTHGRPPRIDGVFMTHPDVDHSHGLPCVLARLDSGPFYTNGMFPRGITGKRLTTVLVNRERVPVPVYAGDVVRLDSRSTLEVLHPAKDYQSRRANERSLVLRLVRDGRPLALLTGDVERDGIDATLSGGKDLRAQVLVLPHHGSRSSYSPALYAAVSPAVAVCSDGFLNRYGFPHDEVVGAVGAPVWSTGKHGRVDITWRRKEGRLIQSFSFRPCLP